MSSLTDLKKCMGETCDEVNQILDLAASIPPSMADKIAASGALNKLCEPPASQVQNFLVDDQGVPFVSDLGEYFITL